MLIDLSQVALVSGRVVLICKRTDKLGKVALFKAAKALGRVLISFALGAASNLNTKPEVPYVEHNLLSNHQYKVY